MSAKTTDMIGSVLLIVLMFPTIIFGASYANAIYADTSIDIVTRDVVHIIPLVLAIVELMFALYLIYEGIKH